MANSDAGIISAVWRQQETSIEKACRDKAKLFIIICINTI